MNQSATFGSASSAQAGNTHQFEFTGSGGEYFRIWIVNLLLSIVTLGIYSAWAKVRRLRYFYGNTSLAGSSFEYHGEPLKILKGRLIAAGLIVPYSIASEFSPLLALVFAIGFLIALPFIVVKSRQFQTRVSSWRNIRFDFAGSYKQAAIVYLGLAVLIPLTLGLIIPYTVYARHKFLNGQAKYGTAEVEFGASPGTYYIAHLIGLGIFLAGAIAVAVLAGVLIGPSLRENMANNDPLAMLGYFWQFAFIGVIALAIFFYAFASVQARLMNAAYGQLRVGGHDLKCDVEAGPLAGIYITNALFTALTLGLFTPWAKVRLARYQFNRMQLETSGSLDEFVANESKQVAATGSEVGDLLDLDFGL